MSKALAPRNTKPDSRRELTNSNLFSIPGPSEKKSADCTARNWTIAECTWLGSLGRRFLNTRLPRTAIGSFSTLEKPSTSLFQALTRQTGLDQLQLGRGLSQIA